MDFDGYPMQILFVIGRACRPNSLHADRVWMRLAPPCDLRDLTPHLWECRSALIKANLIVPKNHGSWSVKPTRLGYAAIEKYREHRRALRERPVLYDPIVQDVIVLDQRFTHFAPNQ